MDHRIASHEAAHCAVAIAAAGWVPAEVRVDRPDLGIAGRCTANFRDHGPDLGWLIAVLAGPLSEGRAIAWPPAKDADDDDERIAARLVEYLELDEGGYHAALAIADHLLVDHQVKAMLALVATALDRVPVLTERQLRELLGPHHLQKFKIDTEEA